MNILITGAASGIARSTIEKLKKKRVHLYVTTHTVGECELLKKKYQNNKNIEVFKLDVTDKKDREKVKKLEIDILFCNAAIGMGGSILEIDMNRVRENFETNVFSNFSLVQLVLKKMQKKGKGRVVMMASLAGLVPLPFLGSYCATKASIIKMTESLRKEMRLLSNKIDIILIEPGFYKTGFNKVMFDNKYENKDTLFKEELDLIRAKENLLLTFLARKKLDSITHQILRAFFDPYPKRVYKAPFFQKLGAKLYLLFRS